MFQVDNIRQIDELPDEPFIAVRAWDLAGSEGKGAFTVGLKLLYGEKSQQFYIADVVRQQLSGGAVRDLIQRVAEEDGITTRIIYPRDPGQAGKVQAEDIGAMLRGFIAKSEAQSGSKELRAEPFASQVEIGKVSILKRTWTKAFLDELRFFPKGKFKDQVDASASAFNELAALTRRNKKTPMLSVVGERHENVHKVA
jgi:predicted phage terminase large subunit-like protein